MVVRMRRQSAVCEVDAPPIEQHASRRDRDEHCGVAVLCDSDSGTR
jgi:hypothetical protein